MNKNDFKNIPKRAEINEITCARAGCHFAVVPESRFCAIHHTTDGDLYKLDRAKIADRIAEIRKHPDSRNLEVELALIRHILEGILQKSEDMDKLLRNSGTIGTLIDKIQALLSANIRVGQITGTLLSIEDVVTIAQALVAIVGEYVDENDVEEIMTRFQQVIGEAVS